MRARGERGSIVSLICDAGERYHDTLFAPGWIAAQGLDGAAGVQDSAAIAAPPGATVHLPARPA